MINSEWEQAREPNPSIYKKKEEEDNKEKEKKEKEEEAKEKRKKKSDFYIPFRSHAVMNISCRSTRHDYYLHELIRNRRVLLDNLTVAQLLR
jgi:hypothetical protein